MTGLLLLAAGAVGIGLLVLTKKEGRTTARSMVLINGKRYMIAFNNPPGNANDPVPMFVSMGFCDPSHIQPIYDRAGKLVQVQFQANWCQKNTPWDVPSNVAIAEV